MWHSLGYNYSRRLLKDTSPVFGTAHVDALLRFDSDAPRRIAFSCIAYTYIQPVGQPAESCKRSLKDASPGFGNAHIVALHAIEPCKGVILTLHAGSFSRTRRIYKRPTGGSSCQESRPHGS